MRGDVTETTAEGRDLSRSLVAMLQSWLRVAAIAAVIVTSAACDTTSTGSRATSILSFATDVTRVIPGDAVTLTWYVENPGQHEDPATFSCSLSRRFELAAGEHPTEVSCHGQHVDVPHPPPGSSYVRYQLNALKRPYDPADPYLTAVTTVTIDTSATAPRVIGIDAGYAHSLALRDDGTVWAWGSNAYRQLGDGTAVDSRTPVRVSGLGDVIAIAAGRDHALALRDDGTVWAWGSNWTGQLGDGTTNIRSIPVQVGGLADATGIAAGTSHSLALRADGTVWAWGENVINGQLGDGTTMDRLIPVQVSALDGIIGIASAGNHSLALRDDGTVWAWGANGHGQLGDGTTTRRLTPIQVNGVRDATAVAAGSRHSLTILGDSSVVAWGHNEHGQLGDGTVISRTTQAQVLGLSDVRTLTATGYHSLALRADGSAWAWGANSFGQLGDGSTSQRVSPVRINSLGDAVWVATGSEHSLALRADGTVWAWGNNWLGQLGDGTTHARVTPVQIADP